MLQRQRQFITQVHRFVDAGLAGLAFWLAYGMRDLGYVTEILQRYDIHPFSTYAWLLLVIIPAAPLILQAQGYYDRPLMASRRRVFWQLFWGSVWTVVLLILISFLFRLQPARGVILLFGPISFLLLLIKEEIIRRWVTSGVGQAQLRRRLILVGAASDTEKVRRELVEPAQMSLEVVAEVDLNRTTVDEFLRLLHEHAVNAVLLTAKHTYFGQVEKVIAACELEGVEVWLMANFFQTRISQTVVDDFAGRPMLVFRCTPDASWQALSKQLLDLIGASALLLVSSPVMLVAVAAIKLTSPGPILFRQQRCGLNGRPFKMLKFRSMVSDAEQRKHEIEILNEMSGPVFKVTNDPRITAVGRMLRKYSIDEFPQLLNVLRGEMSLVGPRPLPLDEVRRFDDLAHRRRLSVKPGITCLWQVSGRNNVTDFKDWVRLDLEYIDNWSLWLDLKILARTVPVVLLGTGAK
ncbi:MAG: sugar transferase [Verrucomicrobia bacterium]|nr:sugar transferase [Verrucomicrobiota bacterium]